MAKHTVTDKIHTPLEEVEWILTSRENTDVLSSSWSSVTKKGVEV